MSQTETLLLVVLGFSLAALIALFVGRLLWKLAIRLGARRMQRQAPTTMSELHTERDRLRAEYALISQKLGARLESVKGHMAEQMAEVSRTRNRIESLTVELNGRDAALAAAAAEKDALAARLATADNELQQLRGETAEQAAAITALEQRLRQHAAHIATLAPPPEEILAASDPEAAQQRLQQRIDSLAAMSQTIAEARETTVPPKDPALQHLEDATRETDDIQRELARLDAAWNEKLAEPSAPAGAPVANVVSLAKRIRSLKTDTAK